MGQCGLEKRPQIWGKTEAKSAFGADHLVIGQTRLELYGVA